MLLAHAGHAHGHDMGTHGHAMSAPATANTKVSSTLSVSACWIRSLPAPAPSAGYFLIKNTGSKSAKLQSASSATYAMVMLHQTTHQHGMSKMSEPHDIVIPAGGKLEFMPVHYKPIPDTPGSDPAMRRQGARHFLLAT